MTKIFSVVILLGLLACVVFGVAGVIGTDAANQVADKVEYGLLAKVLFWAGLLATGLVTASSVFSEGEDKRGWVALPFLLLLAAAVAHYLGL